MKSFKVLDDDGKWLIYFNPRMKMDREIHYDIVSGYFDESFADMIVNMFNNINNLQDNT